MEKRTHEYGNLRSSERYRKRAEDADKHAAMIRAILEKGGAELE
jgi:hypothetical protein